MFFTRKQKQIKYEFLPDKSMIKLREGMSGIVEYVEAHENGDRIFYRGSNKTHYLTFEIADYDNRSDSMKHRLPSSDRLRSYDDSHLSSVSQITGIPLAELIEIRELEKNLNLPKPRW